MGVIWVASPFGYNLPFHGDDDDGGDGNADEDCDDDDKPIGWNWPGTRPLVDSFSETRVTEPPWVMFVTNLFMRFMMMRRRWKMMHMMMKMRMMMIDFLWVRFIMNLVTWCEG